MQYFLAMTMVAAAATAQVHLPSLPLPARPCKPCRRRSTRSVDQRPWFRLSELRHARNRTLDSRQPLAWWIADPNGDPIVRHEILVLAPTRCGRWSMLVAMGFAILREQSIGSMNLRVTVFKAPAGIVDRESAARLARSRSRRVFTNTTISTSAVGRPAAAPRPTAAGSRPASSPATTASRAVPSARRFAGYRGRFDSPGVPRVRDARMGLRTARISRGPRHRGRIAADGAQRRLSRRRARTRNSTRPMCIAEHRPAERSTHWWRRLAGWCRKKCPVINVSLVGPKNALLEQRDRRSHRQWLCDRRRRGQ